MPTPMELLAAQGQEEGDDEINQMIMLKLQEKYGQPSPDQAPQPMAAMNMENIRDIPRERFANPGRMAYGTGYNKAIGAMMPEMYKEQMAQETAQMKLDAKGTAKKKMSASERMEFLSMQDAAASLDELEPQVEKYKNVFGGGGMRGDIQNAANYFGIEKWGVTEYNQARIDLTRVLMRFQAAISGKQMTQQERDVMKQFLPTDVDSYTVIKSKIAGAKDEMARLISMRESAYEDYDLPKGRVAPARQAMEQNPDTIVVAP